MFYAWQYNYWSCKYLQMTLQECQLPIFFRNKSSNANRSVSRRTRVPLSPTLGPPPPIPSPPEDSNEQKSTNISTKDVSLPESHFSTGKQKANVETASALRNTKSNNVGQDFPLIDDEDVDINSGSCSSSAFSTPARRNYSSVQNSKVNESSIKTADLKNSSTPNKSSNLFNRQTKASESQETNKASAAINSSSVKQLPATPLTDPAKFGIPVRKNAKDSSSKLAGIKSKKNKSKEDKKDSSGQDSIVPVGKPSLASPDEKEDNLSMPNSPSKYSNLSATSSSSMSGGNKSMSSSGNNNSGLNGKKTFMQAISGIFKGGNSATASQQPRTLASPEEDSCASLLSNDAAPTSISSNGPNSVTNTSNASQDRKSRSDTLMRFAKGLRSSSARPQSLKPSSNSIQETSKSNTATSMKNLPSHNNSESATNSPSRHPTSFRTASLSMRVSHPSTPPIPLSRKITIGASSSPSKSNLYSLSQNSQNDSNSDLDAEADDFETSESPDSSSLNVGMALSKVSPRDSNMKQSFAPSFRNNEGRLQNSKTSKGSSNSLPPEILEKLMRRGGKTAKRAAKLAQLKRVRIAQEIQRELEELDVKHKDLEKRGIKAERSLRGEDILDDEELAKDYEDSAINSDDEKDSVDNPVTIQMWFSLLSEKNSLVRREQELLVQAKMLELEDRSSRLETELRDQHLLLDRPPSKNENEISTHDKKNVAREGQILAELLEISEQRELLQSMLSKDRARYQQEDMAIEEQMKASGLRIN